MNTENSTSNVLLRIFIFTFFSCLVVKAGVYFYSLDYFSHWSETQARVINIQRVKNVGGTRAGYSISMDLEMLSSLESISNKKNIHHEFGLSSRERSLFLEKTQPNQRISIWTNDKYHAIEIIEPIRPQMFSNFWWYLGIGGPIFLIIGVVVFGEVVKEK